ncbi:30S ribosomal protein S16 [Actinopolymorpha sp. B17G11]|uniref:30S ribosomal protein S16 n=1 Tax=unclassified Actinopolymorpha TaxID=2627063 RepID=UPI0032D8E469
MAVKIRLKRMGKIRAPYYRIVVADSRTKRDGKTIEQIGKYHPKTNPSFIEVDSERAQYWLSVGAQPSEPVVAILKRTGDWQKFKGEPPPAEPLQVPPTKADKRTLFDEALRDAHSEPATEAVSQKKARSKSKDSADEAGKAEKKPAKKTAKAADTAEAKPEDKADAKAEDKAEAAQGESGA